jgi:NAD(P)-dependent dehydrogenase (short-subunit alcohol dehydrogenase family)
MGRELELKDKVAIVTGAGSGIGKAAAIRLAQEGARVACVELEEEEVRETVEEIRRSGGEAMAVVADVSSPEDMERGTTSVADQWGRIDIVFANAGINGVWAPLEELEPEEWDKTLNINLKGTFLSVKYAVPHLKKRGGAIVVTSSVNGTRTFSNRGASAYSSSKAGQVAFTKMIALELAKHKIRANVICPGAITTNIGENTEQRDLEDVKEPAEYPEGTIPLTRGEPGTAEQVAELVLFLVSDRSSHISGTEMWIDGTGSLLVG